MTHARTQANEWILKNRHTHTHTCCNENSWRGCRRVHKGEEAGREGGREGCPLPLTLAVRLGIFQREPEITCLNSTLHSSSLLLYSFSSPLFPSASHPSLPPSFTSSPIAFPKATCVCTLLLPHQRRKVCVKQVRVEHSARKEGGQRKGNKSADSRKKRQAVSDSMGG